MLHGVSKVSRLDHWVFVSTRPGAWHARSQLLTQKAEFQFLTLVTSGLCIDAGNSCAKTKIFKLVLGTGTLRGAKTSANRVERRSHAGCDLRVGQLPAKCRAMRTIPHQILRNGLNLNQGDSYYEVLRNCWRKDEARVR